MADFRLRLPQPVIPDYSQGLQALSDAFDYRRERKRQLTKDAEYKRQNDLSEKRLKQQNEREQTEYEMKVSKRNEDIATKIAELNAQGRFAEAEALAASAQYVDPKTGQTKSPGYDRGGERFDPNFQRLQLPEPGQPMPSSDPTAPQGGFGNEFKLRPPGAEAPNAEAPNPYGGAAGMFQLRTGKEVADAGKYGDLSEKMGAKRTVAPSMVMPDGRRIDLNPNEGEDFKLRRAQEQAQRLRDKAADPATTPEAAQYMLAEANRIEAAIPGASAQHLRSRELQDDSQAFKADQANKYQLTAEQKMRLARMRAARAVANKGPKPSDARADVKLDLAITQAGRLLAKEVASSFSYKETQVQNHKFNQMAGALAADPNAALDSVTAGSFVKMAQGGSGVISDQDMEVFWKRIGGVPDRSWQWVANVIDGKIQPEKRAEVLEAVQWLAKTGNDKLTEIRDAMEWQFMNDPVLKDRSDQFLGGYFGDARREIQDRRGPARAAGPVSPNGPAAAGGGENRAKLIEWAKKNPNDLRAKAIMAKYGAAGGQAK